MKAKFKNHGTSKSWNAFITILHKEYKYIKLSIRRHKGKVPGRNLK